MKVVIFGSRGIDRLEEVEEAMEASGVLARITEIVSGCALGVDTLALAYAEKHNLPVKLFPARRWELGGKAAPLRNIEMAAYADFGVAVWDGLSPGTDHMISLMKGRVFVWNTDEADKFIVTDAAQVTQLKAIYENCGPGALGLDWDFSRPGRVSLPRGRAWGGQGVLTTLGDIFPHSSHPWPRPWPEALLAALASADFYINLNVLSCNEDIGDEPETEETREESAARQSDGPEVEEPKGPSPPPQDRYRNWSRVTHPADVKVLKAFYAESGLKRALDKALHDDWLRADPHHNWIFLESGAVVGCGLKAEEGRLTELYLSGYLTNPPGPGGLKKLKRLDLLAGLTSLRKLVLDLDVLDCRQPLAGPASLEELIFSGSRKTSKLPPLSGLGAVKELNLWRLGLINLAPLAGLSALEELDLSDNSIQDLSPLAGLAALKRLDLHANEISDLEPLAGLAALENLKLDDNRISDLGPLNALSGLKSLSLGGNQIRDLGPLAGLAALKTLGLHDNRLRDLAPLAGLKSLKRFYASDNAISDLGPLAGLKFLKVLSLNENEISDLAPLAGLAALRELYLNDNLVGDIFPLAGLTKLRELELSHNCLADLAPLAGLTALTWLEATANQIMDIWPLASLAKLDILKLNDNRIQDLRPLAGLGSLWNLDLKGNQIEDLAPLSGLFSLKWLDLSRNNVQDLGPLARLAALENLDLADNLVCDPGPLARLSALEDLDLKNNLVCDPGPLARLSALERLDLKNNLIRDMSPLAGLSALKNLVLHENEISALPELPGLVKLRDLYLGDNPLRDIRALEKIAHGSAWSISIGRGRPAIETKTRPPQTRPEPTEPEPAGPEPAGRKLLVLEPDGLLWDGSAAAGDISFRRGLLRAEARAGSGAHIYGRRGWQGLIFLEHLAFQRCLKALARQGLLLAVCSSGDPHIARLPFLNWPNMPLALADFAAFKANRRAKADNILDISQELGCPFSEMVFVECCDPDQRTEIRRRLPQVAVPEMPHHPWRYIQALKRGGWFKSYFEAAGAEGGEEDYS